MDSGYLDFSFTGHFHNNKIAIQERRNKMTKEAVLFNLKSAYRLTKILSGNIKCKEAYQEYREIALKKGITPEEILDVEIQVLNELLSCVS